MDIKVIDNFLSKSYHEKLFKILTSADFPWYFINNITQNDSSDLREFGLIIPFGTLIMDKEKIFIVGFGNQRYIR